MPKFLENALRHEGRKKGLSGAHLEKYVYGGMNSIGAMHGSKETAKGREMEKKHMEKESADGAPHNMREMRIEVTRGKDKKVTGHIVHHQMMETRSKGGAFVTSEHESHPFGPDGESMSEGGDGLVDHVARHLGLGGDAPMENPMPHHQAESEPEETE
jgi:hypothetical protein